ncbi:UNVERIFIED_CONTAM: hypothetical protein GTU68_033045 [Idotea baltica]|nr:hypothetical protein [Idotea baltica]
MFNSWEIRHRKNDTSSLTRRINQA